MFLIMLAYENYLVQVFTVKIADFIILLNGLVLKYVATFHRPGAKTIKKNTSSTPNNVLENTKLRHF